MIFKLAFRNVVSKKSSFVIIIFMAFAVALFCVANAVFDSTENGVQTNFISSFTGDLIIRPSSKGQLSLFGDETPVTGKLTKLDCLIPFSDVKNTISDNDLIETFLPQVTGAAALEFWGNRYPIYLFGVHSEEYFSMMNSVHIVSGNFYEKGQKGVLISQYMSKKTGATVGSEVQFTVADGPYFRIRRATVTGVYDYDTNNSIFERFILADPDLLRDIMDMEDRVIAPDEDIAEEKTFLLENDLDWDALFDEATDSDAEYEAFDDLDVFADIAVSTNTQNELSAENSEYQDSTVWNFGICRVKNSSDTKRAIRKLNKLFKKNGWPVQATDWRHAAGSTALYLYWMRLIFNVGIAVILIAGFIIVNNTLTINVLDRTREIGTLRAVGAKKRFISAQCMVETFMMTLTSGVIGSLLGILVSFVITKLHIQFSNSFLVQLFGSEALIVSVTPFNVLKLFILVIALGFIGWIYPVLTAIRVNPVKAMQGAK